MQVEIVTEGLRVMMTDNSISMAKKRSSDAGDGGVIARSPASSDGSATSPSSVNALTSSIAISRQPFTDSDQPTPAHCLHGNEILFARQQQILLDSVLQFHDECGVRFVNVFDAAKIVLYSARRKMQFLQNY